MKKILVVLLLLTAIGISADFNITTTANFDAGTKTNSTNNSEIETSTDNPGMTAGEFQLGNLFGDSFNFNDDNGVTWKWNVKDENTGTENEANITNGYFQLKNTISGEDRIAWAYRNQVDGNFSVHVRIDIASASGLPSFWMIGMIDQQNYFDASGTDGVIFLLRDAPTSNVEGFNITNGVGTQVFDHSNNTNPQWFRINRSDNTFDFDTSIDGITWFNRGTTTSIHPNLLYPVIMYRKFSSETNFELQYDNFTVNSGTFNSTGETYRQDGNWTSASISIDSDQLNATTIIHSGLDSNHYIDQVQWLISGLPVANYTTNINSGSSTTITAPTAGSFEDVNNTFQVKLFLVGNNSSSPVIQEISGTFANSTPIPFNVTSEDIIIVSAPGLTPAFIALIFLISLVVMLKKQ